VHGRSKVEGGRLKAKNDDFVKRRHPVEKRGPGICKRLRTLDSGFRRNDRKNAFTTFCETIKKKRRKTVSEIFSLCLEPEVL
jgi:hypothetical protein